jgi:hypothetical protein
LPPASLPLQGETRGPDLPLDFEGDASYASLQSIPENDPEPLEMYFVSDEENLGQGTVVKNGEKIQMAEHSKRRSVQLYVRYRLIGRVGAEVKAFTDWFHAIITANELDLIICGVPSVGVKDTLRFQREGSIISGHRLIGAELERIVIMEGLLMEVVSIVIERPLNLTAASRS